MKTVIGLSNSAGLAGNIAKKCKAGFAEAVVDNFPDGELYIMLKGRVGKDAILVQSMNPSPNSSLLELVFAARTAKELGAKKVTAVVPYLAYMRQDKRFRNGECVSARHMAFLLDKSIDRLITVDPHLHRIKKLKDVFRIPAKRLTATGAMGDYIKKNFKSSGTLIVGPDIESYQWAKSIADTIGFDATIFLKKRSGSRKVKIHVTEELCWKGKNVVIVDDIISTGHTMIETVKELRKRKPRAIYCACVHAILAEGAYEKLLKAGAKKVISCNSIRHKSNKIDLSGLIADELK